MSKLATKTNEPTKATAYDLSDTSRKLVKTKKLARAQHNVDRHTKLDGMTIEEALATRLVDKTDIKYDLKKGFMTLA